LPRALPRLIKRIDEVDEDELAREFERLVQGNKESITSFHDHFSEDSNAFRIFFELTEKQEMENFITKLRGGNQKQLKFLIIETDCIETFETSQGIEQRHRSVNFNKTYKNRYDKKNKKRLQRKRESHRELNTVQKAGKDAPESQSKKDERFEGACLFCGEKGHKFFQCPMRELVDKLRKEGQVPKALNHTRSQDAGEEYELPVIEPQVRLVPQTRKVSCLLSTLDRTSQLQSQS